jgi:hypothetical protein
VGQGWRVLFWIAAAFNFVVGLLGMLSPEASEQVRLVGLLVFAFGVVYLQVARDPERLGSALWGGVIEKVGAVALLAPVAFGEDGQLILAGIVSLDALLAVGFLAFLLSRGEDF